MRGRFAPSPTGDLHLGGAYVALAAWLRVRAEGGRYVVRMEDLDGPRVVPGAADNILRDLAWLGLDWDEGPDVPGPHAPYEQSRREDRYAAALDRLEARGLVYPCTCSRTEVARLASAPHAGEEGPAYPGLCRDPAHRRTDRASALRLRVPDDTRWIVRFEDLHHGPQQQDVAAAVGDFVLRRADAQIAYQLAVVVDDLDMQIDEVVRGDDLLPSAARQILLFRLLDAQPPRFMHLPMVLGPDGERLAKRHQQRWNGSTVAELRDRGLSQKEVVGALAEALGLQDSSRPLTAAAALTAARSRPVRPRGPWTPPAEWIQPKAGR